MTKVSITREPDDFVLRASIGGDEKIGYYLVYRGEPQAVETMLKTALEALSSNNGSEEVNSPTPDKELQNGQ